MKWTEENRTHFGLQYKLQLGGELTEERDRVKGQIRWGERQTPNHMTYTESTGHHMAIFQYGFSHAEACAASSPWLAMAFSGATSRPGFSLARVILVLEETWGCLLVAFINPGHSGVLRCGFLHFGVGWGQEHQSVMADSLGTIVSSWWKERHDRRVTHSEPFFSLAGPGDLCTQKAASPSHTPWRRRKTTACRGIHTKPRTDTCAQNTPLVETQTAALEP